MATRAHLTHRLQNIRHALRRARSRRESIDSEEEEEAIWVCRSHSFACRCNSTQEVLRKLYKQREESPPSPPPLPSQFPLPPPPPPPPPSETETALKSQLEGMHFFEYMTVVAKLSPTDTTAANRLRACIAMLPEEDFVLMRNQRTNIDDLNLSDRGLLLLCVMIDTDLSLALWHYTGRLIENYVEQQSALGEEAKTESKYLLDLMPGLETLNLIAKHREIEDEDELDIVEETWRIARRGFGNQQEYDEECRFLEQLRAPFQPPAKRLAMRDDVYDLVRENAIDLWLTRCKKILGRVTEKQKELDRLYDFMHGRKKSRKKKSNRKPAPTC